MKLLNRNEVFFKCGIAIAAFLLVFMARWFFGLSDIVSLIVIIPLVLFVMFGIPMKWDVDENETKKGNQ